MATLYPANLLKRADIGNLKAGSIANVIVFNDDFRLEQVIFKGELKH
jgi:N-acetylglucosamine-6-phosphate deacetylase